MSTPLLSIITPSYNYERFLPRTLASVNRAARPFLVEHVVVDDGSTDASWEVLRDTARADRHLVIARQANRGLSATLNDALARAAGEWIGWLNADDLHLPWAYQALADGLAAHDDLDLVFGDTVFIDADDRVLRLVAQPQVDRRVIVGGYNMFHNCSTFWRRSALPSGWTFDENMHLFMDLDLWLTVLDGARAVAKVDFPLGAYRRHSQQISSTARPSDLAEMRTLATRHGLRSLARLETARATWPSAAVHAVTKTLDGSRIREWRFRTYAGRAVDEISPQQLTLRTRSCA